ncbi:hypothetical protein ACQ4LE_010988 [Meloidogyne hapla]
MNSSLNLLKNLACNSSVFIQTKCAARAAFSVAEESPEPPIEEPPKNQNPPNSNQQNSPNIITLELEQLQNNKNERPVDYFTLSRVRHLIGKISSYNHFDENFRMLLFKSSAKLYYDCSNSFNYITLHKEFGLDDNYATWYRLTLLHVWMVLTHLQQTMEVYSYCYLKKMITQNFHHDKTNRFNTIFKDQPLAKLTKRSKFRDLYYDVYMSSLFEYDDGFLGDDKYLAGAVWRSLYLMDDNADIIHIERVVRYIRETLHFLDNFDTEVLLASGIDNWRPADEIVKRVKI